MKKINRLFQIVIIFHDIKCFYCFTVQINASSKNIKINLTNPHFLKVVYKIEMDLSQSNWPFYFEANKNN